MLRKWTIQAQCLYDQWRPKKMAVQRYKYTRPTYSIATTYNIISSCFCFPVLHGVGPR